MSAQLPSKEELYTLAPNLRSWDLFINGDDTQDVLTRLSKRYPTLQKAIKELFENSGIAGRFKTVTDLQSSSLVDGDYALVADDTEDKNGIYIKEGGVWVKSKYDANFKNKLQRIEGSYYGLPVLEWVTGSISGEGRLLTADFPTNSWNDTARLTVQKTPAKNSLVRVSTSDPELIFKIVTWNEEGAYSRYSLYENEQTRLVPAYFNIVAKYKDGRIIDEQALENIKSTTTVTRENPYLFNLISELTEKNATLSDLFFKNTFTTRWVKNRSYIRDGSQYYYNQKRAVMPAPIEFRGLVKATSNTPDLTIEYVEFDRDKNFIRFGTFSGGFEKWIDGYFDIIAKYRDERNFGSEELDIEIELYKNSVNTSDPSPEQPDQVVSHDWLEKSPKYSSSPFGRLIGETLPVLQQEFDALVAKYPYETKKEVIGVSSDGLHDIHAYTLSPNSYETVIAITMHIHGNERLNPLGFYTLLDMFGNSGQFHPLIHWLRDKVKWYVVPFVSPTAVVNNTRATGSVNANRLFDYLLYETNTQPYALSEARALYDYFKPKRHEIGFNLDLHDIPGPASYSYKVPHHTHFLWLEEQRAISKYLEKINNGKASLTYTSNAAAIRSMFLGSFGIPSITPEHVTMWWINRGLSPDQQVAKSIEQICAYLSFYKEKLERDSKDSSLYTRKFEASFTSVEDGNPNWSREQVLSAFEEIDFLTRVGDIFVNNNEASRTILVVSGVTADTNNSDLTLLRVLQRVSLGNEMLLDHLKNANLVIVPSSLNGGTESSVTSKIQALIAQHNPYYTLIVQADNLTAPVGRTTVETLKLSNVTRTTKESGVEVAEEQDTLVQGISARYAHIKLKNEVSKHAHYPHTVANWVGLVANDLASVFSEV